MEGSKEKAETTETRLAKLKEIREKIQNREYKDEEELKSILTKEEIITEEERTLLLQLFEESINVNSKPTLGNDVNYENILNNLENKIRKKEFTSKEKLSEYIQSLKKSGIPNDVLTVEKITSLLSLYDSLNQVDQDTLDLREYSGTELENQNYIIKNKNDSVLLTETYNSEMPTEFQKYQNKATAINNDGLANADETYDYMRDNIKKEAHFLTVEEALSRNELSTEFRTKIAFFISNEYINPNLFRIDIENEVFQNTETFQLYEVRRNNNGKFEIYSGDTKVYSEDNQDPLEHESTNQRAKGKVLTLKNPNIPPVHRNPEDLNRAAFVQSSLLFVVSIVLGLILSAILFINK